MTITLAVAGFGAIDPWIPLMMFTITFGLSMDYEVWMGRATPRFSIEQNGDQLASSGLGQVRPVSVESAE